MSSGHPHWKTPEGDDSRHDTSTPTGLKAFLDQERAKLRDSPFLDARSRQRIARLYSPEGWEEFAAKYDE